MQRTTRLKRPQVPEPGALIDFDDIVGRPKYAGEEMTSETDIPSVTAEAEARQAADQEIWTEIETIEASSDVVDVVATYADLQQYDTSTLHDKDLIKVLQDETHQNAITYYRYSSSSETFSYVGAEGPYYTASETDTLLAAKQDTLIAGTNVQIAADGKTISATDTTYDDFVGATALSNGEQGLVPAPLSTDANKFLQGDGSWGTPANTTYTAGTNVQISANNEISATDTTYSPFVGASSSVVGSAGLVPQPAIGDQNKYLKGDGTWATVQGGSGALAIELSADPGDPNTSTFNIVTGGVDWKTISDAFSSGQPVMFFYETPGAFNRLFKQYQLLKVYMDSDSGGNYRFFVIAGEDGTISTIKGDEPSVHPPVPGTVISGTVTHLTPMTSLPVASTTTLGGVKVGNLMRISNGVINAREMIGATTYAGVSGYVPQPQAGDRDKFLKGDGTWATVQSGAAVTTFYISGPPGTTTTLYKDVDLQQVASSSDLISACSDGPVKIGIVTTPGTPLGVYYDIVTYDDETGVWSIPDLANGTNVTLVIYAHAKDPAKFSQSLLLVPALPLAQAM